MSKVILRNVNKIYDNNVRVVKDNSLEIHDKEFMVLVGPSGCGKSTTLRMIAGLEEITSGEILIGDRVVNDVLPKDRNIAMVFQNYALYPHMTVFENLSYGLKLRKTPKDEINKRVNEAAEILGLKELLNRKPKALSGGQRQRVAVGRAIVRKPEVFLFDEPLSNLDAKLRVQMRSEISKLHKRLQTTIIYVTHDQVEAMTMGDRITVLNGGDIQQVDTPLNLYDNPRNKFVAGFIGSPAMNFFDGKIIRKDGKMIFSSDNINLEIDKERENLLANYVDKEIILGVRPENFEIAKEGHINAKVDIIEPMGSEIYVYFSVSNSKFVAKFNERINFKLDEKVMLNIKDNQYHFFDKDTELNIFYKK